MDITRRNFMRGVALSGLGVATAGFASSCAPTSRTESVSAKETIGVTANIQGQMSAASETHEGDVVVVGCGPGGIACATRLAEKGAKVILVEKTGNVGGTGMVCSGNAYIALNSRYQTDQGLVADTAAFYREWLEAVHYHCDHEVLSTYLRNCGQVVDWLLEYGFGFNMKTLQPTNGLSGNAYRISQPPRDGDNRKITYTRMVDFVVSKGGEFAANTTASEPILDNSGAIVGVRAKQESKNNRLYRKGCSHRKWWLRRKQGHDKRILQSPTSRS